MKRQIIATLTIALAVATTAGTLHARGPYGNRLGTATATQSMRQIQTQTQSQVNTNVARPADSRRRDGTFLITGTTANGSTTRPGNGRGAMDGSGLAAPTTP